MEKLFWQDAYLKKCEAVVKSLNFKDITLDKTVLFAFSGGQASDKGTINGNQVLEALVSGEDIVYSLENEPDFKEGDSVKVVLDWENRYKLMKLHTAAHIVYYIFKEMSGQTKLIGSNITVEKSRIDYEMDTPVSEYFEKIQAKLDDIIAQDLEVKIYDDETEAGKRWWEVGEWKMPCGGTHVKKTGEIGKIRLKRKNIGAGKERIEIILSN
jgi:Ser-tRNA(Ala) deacylase AlaX|tara:strand:- start:1517 stop:2152 length:636 start_codon:yes stop_codon:yes gene_type:complete